MKKHLPLMSFALVCALSMFVFYVSGLPLEHGHAAACWVMETLIIAVGAGALMYMRPGA